MDRSIDLPENLTEAQLDGRACIRCGTENEPMRPVEAWSELSSQLFECVDTEACEARGDAKLEARSEAEEATANAFFEADQREAEHEQRAFSALRPWMKMRRQAFEMFEEDE